MTEISLGKKQRIVNTDNLKGGIKRSDFANDKKSQAIFDAFNTTKNRGKNEVLDTNEINNLISTMQQYAKDDTFGKREVKRFIKELIQRNSALKDANIGVEDIYNFIEQLSAKSADMGVSERLTDGTIRSVTEKQNSGDLVKTTQTVAPNGSTTTVISTLLYHGDSEVSEEVTDSVGRQVSKTVYNGNRVISSVTYKTDSDGNVELGSDNMPVKIKELTTDIDGTATTFDYENNTKTVKKGSVTTTYSYFENAADKYLPMNSVADIGYDNQEITTYSRDLDGTLVSTVTKDSTGKVTTTYYAEDGVTIENVEIVDKNKFLKIDYNCEENTRVENEFTYENLDDITNNKDNFKTRTSTVYNSEGHRTSQKKVVDGKEFHVNYDGEGNTTGIIVQFDNQELSIEKFCKKFGIKDVAKFKEINGLDANAIRLTAGQEVKVPGEMEADAPMLLNRDDAATVLRKQAEWQEAEQQRLQAVQEKAAAKIDDENKSYVDIEAVDMVNLPDEVKSRVEELKKTNNKAKLHKANDGVTIITTDSKYMRDHKIGEIEIKYDKNGRLLYQTNKYNNGKIIRLDYTANPKKTVVLANEAPEMYRDIAADLQKKFGGNAYLEYDNDSKKYVLVQTNLQDSNVSEIRTVVNDKTWFADYNIPNVSMGIGALASIPRDVPAAPRSEDYFLSQTTTYKDGKVTEGTYDRGKVSHVQVVRHATKSKTTTSPVEAANAATKPASGISVLHVAADITFSMPPDAPENAKIFAQSLIDNKEKLMSLLNIDNDTYNVLAQTAIGIAGKETNFGEFTVRQFGKDAARVITGGAGRDWSRGITQLKYSLYMNPEKEPEIYRNMLALDITNEGQLDDPATSALGTMVVLAQLNKRINSERYQSGIEAAQDTITYYNGWQIGADGIAQKTGETKVWNNEITRQDALCALWQGAGARDILNGTFKPQGWEYTRVVRQYTDEYKLVETKSSRAKAQVETDRTRPFAVSNSNNGDMGGVVFLPAMYTDKTKLINKPVEIQQLRSMLSAKGVNKNLINQLVSALQNGELAFDFGLSKNEINSLNNSDIQLILKHLDTLKKKVNADSAINTSDGISAAEASRLRSNYASQVARAEDSFKREYLNNHSKTYVSSQTNQSVLRETSTYMQTGNYVGVNGTRRGFQHETPRGVNVNTSAGRISQESEVLAMAADAVVKQNASNSSGQCLTGVKSSMSNAGIDVSDMVNYGSQPRYVKNWFDKHSEMFTPLEYVSTGENSARAINASDLYNLPAGCIVIWVPDDSVRNLNGKLFEGHIAITNGNGQGYADATDNLNWADFNSSISGDGKGEHGKFYVYKLSDNWEVGSDGKLKLKNK